MEKINAPGPQAIRAAPLTADEWIEWAGFSATLVAGVGGFLGCWLFGA